MSVGQLKVQVVSDVSGSVALTISMLVLEQFFKGIIILLGSMFFLLHCRHVQGIK